VIGHITDQQAESGLARRELPDPEAADDQIVMQVRAFAVNRGELNLLQQRLDGWMPGQDVAGVVIAAAPDGSGPPVGARVVGIVDGGGWSQKVPVSTHRVAAIPDSVSFADAAPLGVAGLTALRALRTGGPLNGARVLVTGASGGVGHFAVQLAKDQGAHVTGHVSGPHRIDTVRALGADEVVTKVDESVGPFDLVVEGVGGPTLVDAIRRLAPGGTVSAYGNASGERAQIVFGDFRSAPGGCLKGFFVYGTDQRTFGEDLGYMARLIAEEKLNVHSEVREDWAQTREAIDRLRQHAATGKVVLTID
jgi:NADPH:quinone reductase-like Zn-dependent oxidoreductase